MREAQYRELADIRSGLCSPGMLGEQEDEVFSAFYQVGDFEGSLVCIK